MESNHYFGFYFIELFIGVKSALEGGETFKMIQPERRIKFQILRKKLEKRQSMELSNSRSGKRNGNKAIT
jgi:hypothetical protein